MNHALSTLFAPPMLVAWPLLGAFLLAPAARAGRFLRSLVFLLALALAAATAAACAWQVLR
ncbi:MAG: hypothetical protein IK066_06695, partial [Kiritimatiellae bacterium]|nr:hypothetical protein [Kiritimatiellia bacterium]